MTAETKTAGAVSHKMTNWHSIEWQKVHQNVRRLQARIVKATQAGEWGKVKALQRLLTHSFSGKALAVKRVTENQGRFRYNGCEAASHKGRLKGLSGINGNIYVPFLGGLGAAMPPGYPIPRVKSLWATHQFRAEDAERFPGR